MIGTVFGKIIIKSLFVISVMFEKYENSTNHRDGIKYQERVIQYFSKAPFPIFYIRA
jgi:hypothetical protein